MKASDPIRIVIIDDHALFRAGLKSLLSQMPGIQIVGEGANGLEALRIVNETKPDILLLDVNMPVLNGVETVEKIRRFTDCRILMLTISKREEDLMGAIKSGADGYILKNATPEELLKAITLAAEGKSTLSPEITNQVIQAMRESSRGNATTYEITPREKEILLLLSKGKTNPQISLTLHISENTVKTHVRNIMDKLKASTRTEAVTTALRLGIL